MAVSQQTQAIIDELKNQGDLVRNSGTNSVRSVKIQMDKFEGLFQSINTNIAQQTEILKIQAGIASEAEERRKTQEQLDELKSQARKEEVTGGSNNTNETINKIGDQIAEAFSFKNLLIGGVAAFAGYNLLKGFINESTDGGFDRFEDGISSLGTKLMNFEMPDMKTTLDDLNKTIASMQTTIDELRTEITNTIEKLTSWQYWIGLAISAVGPFMAINYYLKNRLVNAKIELERLRLQDSPGKGPNVDADAPTQPRAPEVDADTGKRPIGFDAEGRPTYSDTPNRPPVLDMDGRPITPDISRAPTVDADAPTQPRSPGVDSSSRVTIPGVDGPVTPQTFSELSPQQRAGARPDIARATGGRVRFNEGAGRFTNQQGGFISDAEAIQIMNDTVNPRYSAAYSRVVKLLKIIAPFATAYEIYRFYQVFNDESLDRNTRIARLSGILSGFMTGTAMGLLASRATMMFGPWASLISGLIVGISFGFGAEYLTEAIVKWILDEADDGTITAQVQKQSEIMERYSDYSSYISAQERLQMGGAPAFADSGYIPDMPGMSLGTNYATGADAGSLSSSPYYRGNYWTDKNGVTYFQSPDGRVMRASERPNFVEKLDTSANGNGVTVIDAQTNVSAPMMISDAGSAAQITNIFGEQGRGNGYSQYGLTSALS